MGMLHAVIDIADQLSDLLATGPVALDDTQLEELGLFFAANKDDVMNVLKGGKAAVEKKPKANSAKKLQLADESAA